MLFFFSAGTKLSGLVWPLKSMLSFPLHTLAIDDDGRHASSNHSNFESEKPPLSARKVSTMYSVRPGSCTNKGALKTYSTQPTIKERGEEAHMRSAVQGLPHTSSPVSSSRSSCRASTSLSFSIWFDAFTTS